MFTASTANRGEAILCISDLFNKDFANAAAYVALSLLGNFILSFIIIYFFYTKVLH